MDYDQPGTDTAEFAEIFNPGPDDADLKQWTLEHVNGNGGAVIWTLALGTGPDSLPAGGYLVVGSDLVTANVPSGVMTLPLPSGALQNGAPDGLRLMLNGTFFDGLAWEGIMAGTGEVDSAGTDAGDGSLARCPNGADTDINSVDFTLVTQMTPGEANACQGSAVRFTEPHAIYASKCTPCHTTGGSGGHSIGAPDIATAYTSSQQAAYTIIGTKGAATIVRIMAGEMPLGRGCTGDPILDSGNSACLTQAEQDTIIQWIADGQLPP